MTPNPIYRARWRCRLCVVGDDALNREAGLAALRRHYMSNHHVPAAEELAA